MVTNIQKLIFTMVVRIFAFWGIFLPGFVPFKVLNRLGSERTVQFLIFVN